MHYSEYKRNGAYLVPPREEMRDSHKEYTISKLRIIMELLFALVQL